MQYEFFMFSKPQIATAPQPCPRSPPSKHHPKAHSSCPQDKSAPNLNPQGNEKPEQPPKSRKCNPMDKSYSPSSHNYTANQLKKEKKTEIPTSLQLAATNAPSPHKKSLKATGSPEEESDSRNMGPKAQFRCFWNAEMCGYFFT